MIPYAKFAERWRGRPLEAFLAAVEHPHLLLTTDPKRQLGTARFRTEAVGEGDLAAAEAGESGLLLEVAKRPGRNAFPMMITVGRAPNNDVVVPDVRVSSFHAYLRRTDRWVVCDASSNGTALDGETLEKEQERPIASGAKLLLARCVELVYLEPRDLWEHLQRS